MSQLWSLLPLIRLPDYDRWRLTVAILQRRAAAAAAMDRCLGNGHCCCRVGGHWESSDLLCVCASAKKEKRERKRRQLSVQLSGQQQQLLLLLQWTRWQQQQRTLCRWERHLIALHTDLSSENETDWLAGWLASFRPEYSTSITWTVDSLLTGKSSSSSSSSSRSSNDIHSATGDKMATKWWQESRQQFLGALFPATTTAGQLTHLSTSLVTGTVFCSPSLLMIPEKESCSGRQWMKWW